MEFGVLGPLDVRAGTEHVVISGARQRLVLASLLLDANRLVASPALVEVVWGDDPPPTARRQVQTAVWQLRRILARYGAADVLRSEAGGYRLRIDPDQIDVLRFDSLVAQARRCAAANQAATAAGLLRKALALWRGPALHGLTDSDALCRQAAHRNESRLAVVEECVQHELRQGGGPGLVTELTALVAEHPLRERLVAALMLALQRSGRQADALATYRQAITTLREQLGVDPGPDLQASYQAVLRNEAAPTQPTPPTPRSTRVRPAQLPAAAAVFVGRGELLAELTALLPNSDGPEPAAVIIAAVSGTAGVGKTALAVHWAHRVADRFPDGQLYVNLRGYGPVHPPTKPAGALRGMLDALGVPGEDIPADLDAQASLYRSVLSGKRTLVVVDNVRDTEQVRLLLPGTPTAMVVVTSRSQLTPLVVEHGAHPLAVDVLSRSEARQLMARRIGANRVAAEPGATDQIITSCAQLPLALSIAAARAQQTGFALTAIAAGLAETGRRLDLLDAGDAFTSVRTAFSWSYGSLTAPTGRLFRLLGSHPGPDISTVAAASLAGQPEAQVHRLLTDLSRANLLIERRPGRYTLHDLLHRYAHELSHQGDPDNERSAAVTRLLDYYLHTAYAAERALASHRDPIARPLRPPVPGSTPEPLVDPARATGWLTDEHAVLLAMARHAAENGHDAPAWQLAWCLDTFLDRNGHWADLRTLWQSATHAAEHLGDLTALAYAHRRLGRAHIQLGDDHRAQEHLERAIEYYVQSGDRAGHAYCRMSLSHLWLRQGDPGQAFRHVQCALTLFQALDHKRGQANALNDIGWFHALRGEATEALAHCEKALGLLRELGDRHGQAVALDSVGHAHHLLGQHTLAVDSYRRAIALYRGSGDRSRQAATLGRLGDSHYAADDPDAARTAWYEALELLTELGHPDGETTAAKLAELAELLPG